MSDAPSTAVPFVHVTVLKEAASAAIVSSPAVRAGETGSAPPADIVDCTLGGGGHTLRMCELTRAARVIGLDLDAAAIAAAGARLESAGFAGRTRLLHTSYVHVGDAIARAGNPVHGGLVQGVVADLGVSSFQLDTGARGFSFRLEGPLDMRFDDTRRDTPTAADLVNKLPQGTLTHIFKVLGEEACAPQVASAIVARRAVTPFTTTRDLAGVIGDCIRRTKQQRAKHGSARGSSAGDGSASSKHPATKCFQALRIAVNRELEAVETLLREAPKRLAVGGRLAIISFHSLEDRTVKQCFQALVAGDVVLPKPDHAAAAATPAPARTIVTPPAQCMRWQHVVLPDSARGAKFVVPGAEEMETNPRARSAVLRVLERVA